MPNVSEKIRAPRIAQVLGIQNEERFLEAHLAYHRMVGVERFYIFLDRSTDRSAEIAARFPEVRMHAVAHRPETSRYVCDFHRLAMDQAKVWALEEGFDWLMILDPDEFAYAGNTGCGPDEEDPGRLREDADLRPLLSSVPPNVLQVNLATREVLPCLEADDGSGRFWNQEYFQGDRAYPRILVHPQTGQRVSWDRFLGHREGKCLIRPSAHLQGFDSHRWTTAQGASRPSHPVFVPVPTARRGWHAHYFVTGHDHWLNKYRQLAHEPAIWLCGTPVETPIQWWKEARTTISDPAVLDTYIRTHVMLPRLELKAAAAAGSIVHDRRIARLIEAALLAAPTAGPAPGTLPPRTIDLSHWEKPELPARGPEHFDLSPAHQRPEDLDGFHPVELRAGRPFRWSSPEARIRAELPAGTYQLHWLLGKWVQRKLARSLTIEVDGVPLRLRWKAGERWAFRAGFRRDTAGPVEFTLRGRLREGSPDPRNLSLPWVELHARRVPDSHGRRWLRLLSAAAGSRWPRPGR